MGNVINLFLKTAHQQPMWAVGDVKAVEGEGLEGDVSFGRSNRQVLLMESEVLGTYGLLPGSVRENITTRGIKLSGIEVGTRLQLGETHLEITGDCTPCSFLDSLRPGLQDQIAGERGLLARVITSGTIRVGDSVNVVEPTA
ncbi:MAG TPA: MOSC domain-containing protein [Anaerolineales bacterium]|nr:MOSC domain-containing protein [Anaerolineales bacterium]